MLCCVDADPIFAILRSFDSLFHINNNNNTLKIHIYPLYRNVVEVDQEEEVVVDQEVKEEEEVLMEVEEEEDQE